MPKLLCALWWPTLLNKLSADLIVEQLWFNKCQKILIGSKNISQIVILVESANKSNKGLQLLNPSLGYGASTTWPTELKLVRKLPKIATFFQRPLVAKFIKQK